MNETSSIKAGMSYGSSMFLAGFVFGFVRVLVVERLIGDFAAVLVELPIMMRVCWTLSQLHTTRDNVQKKNLIVLAFSALATLLLLETVLATLFGKTLEETAHEMIFTSKGILGLTGQMVSSFFPYIRTRSIPKQGRTSHAISSN